MRHVIPAVFWGFSAYVFVVRSVASKLATGDTGVRGAARDRGMLALLAGVLLVPAWLVIGAAPLLSGRAPWAGGLVVTCVGIALAVSSQRAMGASWRIGVARSERTALVTGGPFRWVRNPFFTGMALVAVGTSTSLASWVGVVATAILFATIVVQVRRVEEPYLLATFGDEYVAYAGRTGRFVRGSAGSAWRSDALGANRGAMATRTKTVFAVPSMDCPSEERMIRMALDGITGISDLRCDLQARTVTVIHGGDPTPLLAKLEPLGLGARLSASEEAAEGDVAVAPDDATEARTLRVLLATNAAMFVVELVTGWLAQSSGLIADSLDMLADAMVYGLSLYAVGKAAATKVRAAHVSGVFQGVLAVGVLTDVVRRSVAGSAPEAPAMIGISLLALAANVSCLMLISRHRHGGAHMKASWIFSTNDVLANVGVIVAGALVAWTGSRIPDLVIGAAVGLLVLAGAVRILRLR